MKRWAWLAVLVLLAVPVAGCQQNEPTTTGQAGRDPGGAAAPFARCDALSRPPAGAGTGRAGERAAGSADPGEPAAGQDRPGTGADGGPATLPELSLPCQAGGADVELTALRGPAVVNLWASWCAPCRRELPVLRDFAEHNGGRVHVVGVVSTDTRPAARALAADLGLRFPNLVDERGNLLRALGRAALPVTLLIDVDGRVRLTYTAQALDRTTLDGLVRERLGVTPA